MMIMVVRIMTLLLLLLLLLTETGVLTRWPYRLRHDIGLVHVNCDDFFTFATVANTRGHD